jgi:predicted MPP superfamily phosphohydrolase
MFPLFYFAKMEFMQTLIFSDTHLTKGFNRKKYEFLREIIEPVDRVIINGDFWDGYLTSFDKFVNSEWQKLFPLLKEKQTIYLYGNHDKTKWCDSRVNLFS